jgi:hypothetical protein
MTTHLDKTGYNDLLLGSFSFGESNVTNWLTER